jgi:hypothetical protein
MKKAFEMSTLCNCDIGLVIFSKNDKLDQFASSTMDEIMKRLLETARVAESKTNRDMGAESTVGSESPPPPPAPGQFAMNWAANAVRFAFFRGKN